MHDAPHSRRGRALFSFLGLLLLMLRLPASPAAVPTDSATTSLSPAEAPLPFLWVPELFFEGSSAPMPPGRVFVSQPPAQDLVLRLSAGPEIIVPASVTISAGRQSATFPLQVLDDSVVNRPNRTVSIQVSSDSLAAVERAIRIQDNEPGFPTLQLSETLVEGVPLPGTVRFSHPHEQDEVVTFEPSSTLVVFPASVRIPAGALEGSFTLVATENDTLDGQRSIELCYSLRDFGSTCLPLGVLDNEVDPDRLDPLLPSAVFAGESLPATLRLLDRLGSVSRTNTPGQAWVTPPLTPAVAGLSPQPFPLPFSNGVFNGDLRFSGVALRADIEVSVTGRKFSAGTTDILPGHTVPGPFADLAALPGSANFLTLGGGTTDTGTELMEFSAETGSRLRHLTLPRAAQRLAISDSGATGWCASPEGTVQRIDLREWRLGEEFRIVPAEIPARPLSLAVLTGTEDQVVLLLDTNRPNRISPFQVLALSNGVRRARSGSVNFSSLPGHLIAGRTPNEILADASGRLQAFDLRDDGIVLRESVPASLGPNQTQPNLVRLGETLWRGSGENWSISPLRRLNPPSESRGPAVGLAQGDRVLAYLDPSGGFQVFERASGVLRGSHRLPWPAQGGVPARFLVHASDTFAALTPDRAALLLWRSPLLNPQPADVAVIALGSPQVVAHPTNDLQLSSATDWTWTVTNRGPGTAHGLTLTLDSGARFEIPTLEAGVSRVFTDRRLVRPPAILRGNATLTSATTDPDPGNNQASLRSEMIAPSLPGFRAWVLETRDLARSADGERLWVAVSPPTNEGGPGVLELDPHEGSLKRILSTERDIRRLRPSPDGRFLYLRTTASEVLRWNLTTRDGDLRLDFGAETVTDVLPLPGTAGSFVVSTSERVVVYDGTQARTREFTGPAGRRQLCHAADRVWIVEPGRLIRARVVAEGLEQEGEAIPCDVPEESYEITADDRHLFFPQQVFETDTLRMLPLSWVAPHCPEPSLGLLYRFLGNEVSRLDLPSLNPTATQSLPDIDQVPIRLVRWGIQGFAVLYRSGQLGVFESPVIAQAGGGDAEVRIDPPANPEPFLVSTWRVTVTNVSEATLRNVLLVLSPAGALNFVSASSNILEDFHRQQNRNLGSLPPHGSVTVEVPLLLSSGRYDLSARIVSSALSDLPGNNEARIGAEIDLPEGDLAVALRSNPQPVEAGSVFQVRVLLTNSSLAAVRNLRLQLTPFASLRVLAAEPGRLEPICCGSQVQLNLDAIEAKGSREVSLSLQSTHPGIARIDVQALATLLDSNLTNDRASHLVALRSASSTNGFSQFDFPPGFTVWSDARRQLATVFQGHPALVLLDPQGMSLQREIPLPSPATQLALSRDGTLAWVVLDRGDVAQIRIDDGTLLRRFPISEQVGVDSGSLATLPGDPDLLIVGGNSPLPTASIVAYRHGTPLPDRLEGLESHLAGVLLHATGSGRLFAATRNRLLELRTTASGLAGIRSLDIPLQGFPTLSSTDRHLIFGSGRFLDLESFSPIDLASGDHQIVADPATSPVPDPSRRLSRWAIRGFCSL